MADVSIYRRCIMPYAWSGMVFTVGDTKAASDSAVVANPQWWTSLTDFDISSGDVTIVSA